MSDIHCPKCNSTQWTANKKGFSGKKAVAGAILTGGIGLLAGTIGSGKVVMTCLACGHQFKAGEGVTAAPAVAAVADSSSSVADLDYTISQVVEGRGLMEAIKKTAEVQGIELQAAKGYVDDLVRRKGLTPKKVDSGGCAGVILAFVALGGLLAYIL